MYILDGLLKNTSALQPDDLARRYPRPIRARLWAWRRCLGIQLCPVCARGTTSPYRVDRPPPIKHIDRLLTQVVDWDLIDRYWQDMMQVVLSIQAGQVLPSMILQKLGRV